MVKKLVLAVICIVLCSVGIAGAGWFDDAVDNAVKRTRNRAVDDATDAAYDNAKEKLVVKPEADDSEPPPRSAGKRQGGRTASGPAAPQGDDDEHYIQPDDYFISDNALGNRAWIYVRLAKMTKEPTPQTKGQAEFFRIHDGKNLWTKYFWKTRMATDRDVKLGKVVIMLEGRTEDGVYLPPRKKEEARSTAWFMAKITDMSDLYKNYVTVSGNYKVDLKNLRVIVE